MVKHKFGLRFFHKTDHLEICLVVNEVGSDLSQKGDRHIGGTRYACEKGIHAQNKGHDKDKSFILLRFTDLTTDPVPCLVILIDVSETMTVKAGINTHIK